LAVGQLQASVKSDAVVFSRCCAPETTGIGARRLFDSRKQRVDYGGLVAFGPLADNQHRP
jgi:hypothetical protein